MLVEVKVEDFKKHIIYPGGPRPVLFIATWCPFCRNILQYFKGAASATDNELYIVDISDESVDLWDTEHIEVVPTIVIYVDGEQRERFKGPLQKGTIDKAIRMLNELS